MSQALERSGPERESANFGRVVRLADHLQRRLTGICADHNLTASQFQVLSALRRQDPHPMNAGELAGVALLTTGAMTPVLDRLAAGGLISRRHDGDDRRARRITITPKGASVIDRAMEREAAQHREINAVLGAEERETLAAILRKLLAVMEPPIR